MYTAPLDHWFCKTSARNEIVLRQQIPPHWPHIKTLASFGLSAARTAICEVTYPANWKQLEYTRTTGPDTHTIRASFHL